MDIGGEAEEIAAAAELGGDLLESQGVDLLIGLGRGVGFGLQHAGARWLHKG